MKSISWKVVLHDALLIVVGSIIFAIGVDIFEVPYGLAAGGVTGLAMVFSAVAETFGVALPVGLQTIVINALLMILVVKSGSRGYIARTVAGIIACGFFTDALVPLLPVVGGEQDLLLCALWGGVVTGLGLGLVFRTGGNTGGTDIVAQVVARKTALPVGTSVIIVDGIVIALSATVFSVEQALYAAVAMFICGKVIDASWTAPVPRAPPTSSPRSTTSSPTRSCTRSTAGARSSRRAGCGAAPSGPSSSACSAVPKPSGSSRSSPSATPRRLWSSPRYTRCSARASVRFGPSARPSRPFARPIVGLVLCRSVSCHTWFQRRPGVEA